MSRDDADTTNNRRIYLPNRHATNRARKTLIIHRDGDLESFNFLIYLRRILLLFSASQYEGALI